MSKTVPLVNLSTKEKKYLLRLLKRELESCNELINIYSKDLAEPERCITAAKKAYCEKQLKAYKNTAVVIEGIINELERKE